MANVVFRTPDGTVVPVEAADGSLMQAAVRNGVDGIDADCGASAPAPPAMSTWRPNGWSGWARPGRLEKVLLELEDKAHERSRLACQIKISDQLDGLAVDVVGR